VESTKGINFRRSLSEEQGNVSKMKVQEINRKIIIRAGCVDYPPVAPTSVSWTRYVFSYHPPTLSKKQQQQEIVYHSKIVSKTIESSDFTLCFRLQGLSSSKCGSLKE